MCGRPARSRPVTRTGTRRPRFTVPGTSAVPRNGTALAPAIAAFTVPVTLGFEGRHPTATLRPRGVAVAESARAIGDVVTTNVRCAALPAASLTMTVTWKAPARV